MRRWKSVIPLLAALVLCLGMMGVAIADPGDNPPDGNPACDRSDGNADDCDEDGNPGDSGEGDDENEGEEPEGDANPLAPLGELCAQVVDALSDNVSEEFAQARALCEALGAEPRDDEGEDGEDDNGEGGDEESPTQAIADGCNELVSAMIDGGAPAEAEELRQLCDQFGDRPEDGEDGEDDNGEGGDEESPTQAIADGCNEMIDQLLAGGAPEDVEQGRELCAQFGESSEDDEGDDGEDGASPLQPIADVCNQVVDGLIDGGAPEQFEDLRQVCDLFGERPDEDDDENGGGDSEPTPLNAGCNTLIDELIGGGAPEELEQGRQLCDQLP